MSETKLKMAAQTGGRIMVVDDEEKNRRLLADVLSADGYTVQTVADGMEALQLVTGFKPETILLDVMMPKLDGVEVCRRLKADPVTASIPVGRAGYIVPPSWEGKGNINTRIFAEEIGKIFN